MEKDINIELYDWGGRTVEASLDKWLESLGIVTKGDKMFKVRSGKPVYSREYNLFNGKPVYTGTD